MIPAAVPVVAASDQTSVQTLMLVSWVPPDSSPGLDPAKMTESNHHSAHQLLNYHQRHCVE